MVEKKVEKEEIGKEKKAELKTAKPGWVKMKPAELEDIIVELARKGESPAKIGLILRDKHGVPKSKLLGKRIMTILKEKGISCKDEKGFIDEKIEVLNKHISKNKHDYRASRALTKKLWDLYGVQNR